jgi:ribosomal protein L40E
MQPRLYPYAPERDVYRLLQVEPTAEPGEIMVAIRRLARTFHPDRNQSPRATEEMQVVYAVRNLLIDPQARARYDHARQRFLAETEARRRLTAAAVAVRRRPIRTRIALTGIALLAAFRAILDAFAPARARLLTTSADRSARPARGARRAGVAQPAAPRPAPVPQPATAAPPSAAPRLRIVAWEADAVVVLDPEPMAVVWEYDAEVVLDPLPVRPTVALPVGDPRPTPQASAIAHPASVATAGSSVWEASAQVVAAASSEIGVRKCTHCGLALSTSASFCRRCGTSQARSA